jgi:hypothetical protein
VSSAQKGIPCGNIIFILCHIGLRKYDIHVVSWMFSWIFKSINVRKRIQSRNKEDEMVLSSSKGQMEVEFISGTQLAGSCGPAPSCGVGGLALHPLGTAGRTPWVYARRIGGGLGQMVITSLPSGRS